MKRFIAVFLAVISIFCCMALGSGCAVSDPNTSTFSVSDQLPWNTPSHYEKATYSYAKFVPNDDGSVANIVESGIVVMEAKTEVDAQNTVIEVELKSTMTVKNANDQVVAEIKSQSTMSKSMYPRTSYKSVKVFNPEQNPNFVDNSYVVSADYTEKTSFGNIGGVDKTPISIPSDSEGNRYDNEQLFYLVRSASNLNTVENSGIFKMTSLADSYFGGEFYSLSMSYSVQAKETVSCEKFTSRAKFGIDGSAVACNKVKLNINNNKQGPGTTLWFAENDFKSGEQKISSRVLMKMTREQYNLSFVKEYIHEYVLIDYTTKL